ncbi:aggregation-promoting factor C-terminal-like domain-containing protein [Microbacterium sp. GXF7504]
MTSPDEQTSTGLSPRTRREVRVSGGPQGGARPAARQHWTRRRPAATVFATIAALCLAGATIGPAGLAMAETVFDEDTTTVYDGMVDDAQSLVVSSEAETITDLGRGNYETYQTPKPEPVVVPAATSGGGGGGPVAAVLYYTGGGSPAQWMAAAGIAEGDWGYVDYIVSKESGWNPNATNRSSGACGLVQALPCSKVPGNGYDPVDNLRWGNGYAVGRYGSWAGAYAFWVKNHWW